MAKAQRAAQQQTSSEFSVFGIVILTIILMVIVLTILSSYYDWWSWWKKLFFWISLVVGALLLVWLVIYFFKGFNFSFSIPSTKKAWNLFVFLLLLLAFGFIVYHALRLHGVIGDSKQQYETGRPIDASTPKPTTVPPKATELTPGETRLEKGKPYWVQIRTGWEIPLQPTEQSTVTFHYKNYTDTRHLEWDQKVRTDSDGSVYPENVPERKRPITQNDIIIITVNKSVSIRM
jgi:hypothetical protein